MYHLTAFNLFLLPVLGVRLFVLVQNTVPDFLPRCACWGCPEHGVANCAGREMSYRRNIFVFQSSDDAGTCCHGKMQLKIEACTQLLVDVFLSGLRRCVCATSTSWHEQGCETFSSCRAFTNVFYQVEVLETSIRIHHEHLMPLLDRHKAQNPEVTGTFDFGGMHAARFPKCFLHSALCMVHVPKFRAT